MNSKKNKRKITCAFTALALIAIVVLIIWIKLNPLYAKIFIDKVLVIAFMAVFFWVGWFFMKVGKKKQLPDSEINEPKEDEASDS